MLTIGMYLFREEEVDPQSQTYAHLKQQSLQVLTKQQGAEKET